MLQNFLPPAYLLPIVFCKVNILIAVQSLEMLFGLFECLY